MDSLVSTDWLAAALGAPDLRVLDATYFTSLPVEAHRDARAEYVAGHIPGALFLDLASLADRTSPLPATVPAARQVAARLHALGINDGDRIVLYDNAPHHTAARAWWLLRAFGVRDVAILDGGMGKWRSENRPVAGGEAAQPAPGAVQVATAPSSLRTLDQMRAALADPSEQVLDARSAARFTGDEPDPRPDTAAGHIPGSRNLPYPQLLNPDGTYKDRGDLQAAFDAAGIDLARPVTMTCGSGITAAVLAFAAHLLGRDAAVYDGSWSEWGGRDDTPKALGPA